MKGNGNFGYWITDEENLPAYKYSCKQKTNPIAKTPTTYGHSIDHFHQIGNDRITATVHNGGYVQVLDSSRGFQWLTFHNEKKKKFGGGITLFQIGESRKVHSTLYHQNGTQERIFGMGYFKKYMLIDNLRINQILCSPFSDDPVLISETRIENPGRTEKYENLKILDFWDIYLHHILSSVVVTSNNRKRFGKSKLINGAGKLLKLLLKVIKKDTEGKRKKFDNKFTFDAIINKGKKLIILSPRLKKEASIDPSLPAKHNYYPKSIFLAMLEGEPIKVFYKQEELYNQNDERFELNWDENNFPQEKKIIKNIPNPCLALGTEISELLPNQHKKYICIFGYANVADIDKLIQKYRNIIEEQSHLEGYKSEILHWNAERWKGKSIILNCNGDPWLSRETKWHSYYTRSACYFDEYYNQHKFPQGSIYQFGHGFDGAIRDFILYLQSIIHLDIKLAREYLTFILSLMEPDGKLPYALYGFGNTLSASVHSKPSDLYLFLIWGILQYIYSTRDFDFLNHKIPFYPNSLNKSSTVLERIYFAVNYLFSEKVGFGEHGLIKSNDGDWSDGISLMVKKRKKFIKYGESNFNSTFTLFLLPKLIPLLKKHHIKLAESCMENLKKIQNAVMNTWNGKWFYRGFDGIKNPIGDKNIYLEHHTWLLISKILDKEQAHILIDNIYNLLDKPSPIGQYISYPPQKTRFNILPEGWDVNGGIWHAMNALLTWGYSKYDIEKAFNSLKKNSLAQRAEAYPNIWYGIWSGPDSYIADYAENAGQAFYHLPTPMCDFPLMNLNIHACYLLSVIKIVGIEVNYDSILIDPKIKEQEFSFHSSLMSLESKNDSFYYTYKPVNSRKFKIIIRIPNWWRSDSKILLNDQDITNNSELTITNNNFISIIIENIKKIEIRLLL